MASFLGFPIANRKRGPEEIQKIRVWLPLSAFLLAGFSHLVKVSANVHFL